MEAYSSNSRGLSSCMALILMLAACGPGSLAEADGSRLGLEDAAILIADHSRVPADSQIVRVVAELWVDYTLLASRLSEDSTLQSLDVGLVTEAPLDELMIARLRDEVVDVDTIVSDEELTSRFAADMPGARATASQILLLFPRGATTLQRDSVRAVAAGLASRLDAGADFAGLASSYSDDPGSGARGGSMGTFGRGEMLAPVDSAVFGLRPGETSGPVESGIGYHLLRLDALEVPELSEVGAEFRRQIQLERLAVAEAAYVTRLDSTSGLGLAGGAVELARALAGTTPSRLSRSAAERPLVTWDGGSFSAGDFLSLARLSGEGFGEGVASASDQELEAVLRRLGQEELLLEHARSLGFAPTAEQIDSVSAEARAAIRERAALIGLTSPSTRPDASSIADAIPGPDSASGPDSTPVPGTARETSAASRVEAALIRIVSGETEIIPLGGVTLLLRDQGNWRINAAAVAATLARIERLR